MEQSSSALGSKGFLCSGVQVQQMWLCAETEVPPEQTFSGTLPRAPQLPEGTPNPAATPRSAHHSCVWSRKVWDTGDWDSSTEVIPGKGAWDEDPWQQQAEWRQWV